MSKGGGGDIVRARSFLIDRFTEELSGLRLLCDERGKDGRKQDQHNVWSGRCVPVVKAAVKVVKLVWQAGVVTDCSEGFYVQGDAS